MIYINIHGILVMGLPPFLTRTHKKFNAGGDVHPSSYFFPKKAFSGKVLKIYIIIMYEICIFLQSLL